MFLNYTELVKKKIKNPYLEELQAAAPKGLNKDILAMGINESLNLWKLRENSVKKYSWAIPNQEAIDLIVSYSPLIEIGAGSGYWAYLIRQAGGFIEAYDKNPWAKTYTDVNKGSFEKLKNSCNKTLFLCWPPYADPLAYNCLKAFEGDTVIYVGERGGCTGDEQFESLLEDKFSLIKTVKIPNYPGIHDLLMVYKLK